MQVLYCSSLSWSNIEVVDVVVSRGNSGDRVGLTVGTCAFHPNPPADEFQNDVFPQHCMLFHMYLMWRVPQLYMLFYMHLLWRA